jgi:mannosyltransferase
MDHFITKNRFFLFFVVFAIQLIFNSYQIGKNGFWYDECFSVYAANRPLKDIIAVSMVDVNPPLYPIILHFWIKLFGISEFAVRMLSCLAGSLACSFLFLFCIRFVNWQTAVFSFLMCLTSYPWFFYAQEARTYTMVLLFVVLSNYSFFQVIENSNNKKGLFFCILLGVFNAGLFYLHFLSCLNIIAQGIVFLFYVFEFNKDNRHSFFKNIRLNKMLVKYYSISIILFFVLLIPFLKRAIELTSGGVKNFWLQKPTFLEFKECIYEMFNSKNTLFVYLTLLMISIVLILFKRFRDDNFKIKLMFFFMIGGIGMLLLNYKLASITPIFLLRYVLFTIIGMILLITYLFSQVKINFKLKLFIFSCLCIFSFTEMNIPKKAYFDYKGAVVYLRNLQSPNTLISTDMIDLFSYYYDQKIFNIVDQKEKEKALFSEKIFHQYYNFTWPNDLDFSEIKDIYYTESYEYLNDPNKKIQRLLNRKFRCVQKIDRYAGIRIYHYINENYH